MASEYLTLAELDRLMTEARLIDCTDDDGDGTPDSVVVTDVIQRASSVMDGYFMNAGLTVPLTGELVTPAVRHYTGFLAAHFAAKRRPKFRNPQGKSPYWVERDEALAWAADVAAGKLSLQQTPEPPGSIAPRVYHAARGQIAAPGGARKMRGW